MHPASRLQPQPTQLFLPAELYVSEVSGCIDPLPGGTRIGTAAAALPVNRSGWNENIAEGMAELLTGPSKYGKWEPESEDVTAPPPEKESIPVDSGPEASLTSPEDRSSEAGVVEVNCRDRKAQIKKTVNIFE